MNHTRKCLRTARIRLTSHLQISSLGNVWHVLFPPTPSGKTYCFLACLSVSMFVNTISPTILNVVAQDILAGFIYEINFWGYMYLHYEMDLVILIYGSVCECNVWLSQLQIKMDWNKTWQYQSKCSRQVLYQMFILGIFCFGYAFGSSRVPNAL